MLVSSRKSFLKPFVLGAITYAMCVLPIAYADTTSTKSDVNNKAYIEKVVHEYLQKNPEIIMEAIQTLQRRQYEEAEKTVEQTKKTVSQYANALLSQTNDPIAGNPNGKVTIVEFFDYQCSHCIDMAPVMTNIIKANPEVKVVFKEFPIRGPQSELATEAALAANLQGKYIEFQHALFNNKQPINENMILSIAKDQGLDLDKFKKDMKSKAVQEKIKDNHVLGQNLKLLGTPALFIGKTQADGKAAQESIVYIPGLVSQEQLQQYIDQA